MSIKKVLLVVLVVSAVLVTVKANTIRAQPPELAVVSPTGGSRLSHEIVVSALDNEQYSPYVAYNWKHREYLVVWENVWGGGLHDIYARRVTDQGEVLDEFPIATGPKNRMQPDVAYDPVNDRYLVVWIHDIHGNGSDWNVSGRFIPSEGHPTLPEFTICNWTSSQWKPRVAYARAQEEFLVVWMNSPTGQPRYISARRIWASNGAFPVGGFTISAGPENRDYPDVAYNLARNEYLVTWDVENPGTGIDIYAVRLQGNGNALGGGEFGIAGWPADEERPSVAACDKADQYLVAWQSLQPGGQYDLYVRFVKGDGALDGGPLVVFDTTAHEAEADVACNMSGRQYMIVWQQQYSSLSGPYGTWGRLVFPNKTMGVPLEVRGIAVGEPNRDHPAVAGGYTNYLTVWEHERAGTPHQDVHGRLVTPYGLYVPLVLCRR